MHPNKPTEPGVSAQKPASIEKQPCIAAQPVETHNELYARSASQETDQKAKINKPSAIKPTGFVLAKNKPMVIKPAGGVKKPNKTDKPEVKKSAYLQAMEAYKSQSCSENDVSGRPLVK